MHETRFANGIKFYQFASWCLFQCFNFCIGTTNDEIALEIRPIGKFEGRWLILGCADE